MRRQQQNQKFIDLMQLEVASLNPDIDPALLQNALKIHNLSWKVIGTESEQFVVDKLKLIEDLDDAQCVQLFEVLKQNEPKKLRLEVISSLHFAWIMFSMTFLEQGT